MPLTTGFVEDYDALRNLDHHLFNIVLVRKWDATNTVLDPCGLVVWDDNSLEMDNDSTTILPKLLKDTVFHFLTNLGKTS